MTSLMMTKALPLSNQNAHAEVENDLCNSVGVRGVDDLCMQPLGEQHGQDETIIGGRR